tara:strand:- start:2633 stop:3187 length:555 start_codon:yes stop_codon:yes gene_type:complete
MKKDRIRKEKALLRKKNQHLIEHCSFNATSVFFKNISLKKKKIIGLYWPTKTELDTRPIIKVLLSNKFIVSLPHIYKNEILFKPWNANEKLFFSKEKIYCPCKLKETVLPDLVIVPLLAFDFLGNRIGYGKGFYDRYFNKNNTCEYVGFGFTFQYKNNIPRTRNDLKLNKIVTDRYIKDLNKKT